jgi:hypothetical protein
LVLLWLNIFASSSINSEWWCGQRMHDGARANQASLPWGSDMRMAFRARPGSCARGCPEDPQRTFS